MKTAKEILKAIGKKYSILFEDNDIEIINKILLGSQLNRLDIKEIESLANEITTGEGVGKYMDKPARVANFILGFQACEQQFISNQLKQVEEWITVGDHKVLPKEKTTVLFEGSFYPNDGFYINGTKISPEKFSYSAPKDSGKEAVEFAEWINKNEFSYSVDAKSYYHFNFPNAVSAHCNIWYSTTELYELFKQSK